MDYKEKYEQAMLRMNKWVEGSEITDPKEVAEFVFPELKESEDEKIRKALIHYFSEQDGILTAINGSVSVGDILAWLEKQDSKKHEEELEKAYKCADEVQYRKGYEDAKREIENQNEQKTTDEVKPKFKVGDWIVRNYQNSGAVIYRVVSIRQIDNETYGYDLDDGTYFSGSFEKDYHLWTIQDAKDGDILVTSNGGICIFDNTVEEGIYPFAYCGLTRHHGFEVYDRKLPFTHDKDIRPATKEQRELLFQKMKEAGYEWDAEKKELKKMEQEQTELPNGKDYGIDGLYHAARILEKTLGDVEGYQSDDGILEHRCAIEAVKCLYKQKLAWSEEDEDMIDLLVSILEINHPNAYFKANQKDEVGIITVSTKKIISWLKSLKDRMKGE